MKQLLVSTILILTIFVVISSAQENQDDGNYLTFGVKTGYQFFQSETLKELFSSNVTAGLNLKLGGELVFWTESGWGIGAQLQFYRNSKNQTINDIDLDLAITSIPFHINGYYNFSSNKRSTYSGFIPYFGAGVTFINIDFEGIAKDTSDTPISIKSAVIDSDDFIVGFNVVAGTQGLWGQDALFFEVQYTFAKEAIPHISDTVNKVNAVKFNKLLNKAELEGDVDFGGFTFWIGYRWN